MPEQTATALDLEGEVHATLAELYAPAAVVIDEDLSVVRFCGATGDFLEPAPGSPSLNVVQMAREGLAIPLESVIRRAKASGEPAHTALLSVRSNHGLRHTVVRVVPLRNGHRNLWMVAFEHAAPAASAAADRRREAAADLEIAHLREEVRAARSQIQAAVEENLATYEELRATNADIAAINEALRRINEELETTQEELQAVNEQLESRNLELVRSNDDLHAALASAKVALVMVDGDLKIRRHSPMAGPLLRVTPADVGRPITDIRFDVDAPELQALLRRVIATMQPHEQEVRDPRGRRYTLRVRPHRTADRHIGAIVCLVDTEPLRQSEVS